MNIYARGAEDFSVITAGSVYVSTTAGYFRSGFARCGICGSGPNLYSALTFTPQTSLWLGCRLYNASGASTATKVIGLLKDNTSAVGLWLANDIGAGTFMLQKYDGSTWTTLATTPFIGNQLLQVVMQVINFGGSATVNVWINGVLVINYVGSTAIAGMTNISAYGIGASTTGNSPWISEVIVADSDVRNLGVVFRAPSGTGSTDAWASGAYTDVNEVSNNDATVNNTDTAGQDQQYALGAMPAGVFAFRDVAPAARVSRTSDATATKLKLGVNTGGTVEVGAAADPGTAPVYQEYSFGAINPATGNAWTSTEIANLQLDLQSAS